MEQLTVHAPSQTYDILIGRNIIEKLGNELFERHIAEPERPVAILTSPRIGGFYYDAVRLSLEKSGVLEVGRFNIPDGEDHKNLQQFDKALNWLSRFAANPSRTPLVITLGGGVVGDLGGFVAHTFKRGVPFLQVTTTLLGAVDCSVGGKVAANLPAGKNLVGAFHQPSLVLADMDCLNTLPDAEVKSGMAEVIKYGAILDKDLFEFLEANIDKLMDLDDEALAPVVRRCCELKALVVKQDEYDKKGVRISLNFGHTVGHAIENVCKYSLSHGECVSIGMVAAARLSHKLGFCHSSVPTRLQSLLEAAGLPVECCARNLETDQVLEVMKTDKKWIRGKNRFVLLTNLGAWKEAEGIDENTIEDIVYEVVEG